MAITVDTKIKTDGDSQAILATYAAQTRTQATYTPASESVVAMTSELDIILTTPAGTTKNILTWTIFGQGDISHHGTGFVIYKDIDGLGFNLLANSRDGSNNYWSITGAQNFSTANSTPASTTFQIQDTSVSTGSVNTYRIYVANTKSAAAAIFYLNRAVASSGADAIESGLSTCFGMCLA